MDKITELKNIIHQKFLKIAKRARIKDEDGKSTEHEFCCLMRLQALLIAVQDTPNPTVFQLREMEILANSICGRDRFIYKPVDWCGLDFDAVDQTSQPPISACEIVYSNPNIEASQETLYAYVDKIIDTLNYEFPWIKFTVKEGVAPGKYEVGSGSGFTTIGVTVNKTAKDFYDIDRNGDLIQYARELKNALPDQLLSINFQDSEPKSFLLNGEYFDLQKYQNKHEKAEASLKWESVWPCYYGVGPITSLDDLSQANAFIQSLEKSLDCSKNCHKIDVSEGNVLYYFFPFNNVKKHFVTENGVMMGSYRGTIDGVRTKSMDDYNVAGSTTYGVIRSDQEGIRFLRFCVEDMLIEDVISQPVPPTAEEEVLNTVILYEGNWSELECVKNTETYESNWSELECVKINA